MEDGISTGKIHEAISAIMAEVGGIAKTRKNQQQGYAYRGIADVTLACQPIMAKHGVHITPHTVIESIAEYIDTKSGGKMMHMRQTIEYRFYHADGSWFPCVVTGEAMDSGDKTSNKVMSAALKYALTQTFCIPEEDPTVDTELESPEIKAEGKKLSPQSTSTASGVKVESKSTPVNPDLMTKEQFLAKVKKSLPKWTEETIAKCLKCKSLDDWKETWEVAIDTVKQMSGAEIK